MPLRSDLNYGSSYAAKLEPVADSVSYEDLRSLQDDQHVYQMSNASYVSTFSTNYTTSGIIGAGRTLGRFYSFAGRKIESTLSHLAERAGYGPEAAYGKLCCSRLEIEGKIDKEAEMNTLDLCNKLFDYARHPLLPTRLLAIEKLLEFFEADYSNIGWFLSVDKKNAARRISTLLRDERATPSGNLTDLQRALLTRLESCFSTLDLHIAGLVILSPSGEQVHFERDCLLKTSWIDQAQLSEEERSKWGLAFRFLLSHFTHPEYAIICSHYLSAWAQQLPYVLSEPQLTIELCAILLRILPSMPMSAKMTREIGSICVEAHGQVIRDMSFMTLKHSGLIGDFATINGEIRNDATTIKILNDLAKHCKDHCSSTMRELYVPTMNGFVDSFDKEFQSGIFRLRAFEQSRTGGSLTWSLCSPLPEPLKWIALGTQVSGSGKKVKVYLVRAFYKGRICPGWYSEQIPGSACIRYDSDENVQYVDKFEMAVRSDKKVEWVKCVGPLKTAGLDIVIGGYDLAGGRYELEYFYRIKQGDDDWSCGGFWKERSFMDRFLMKR